MQFANHSFETPYVPGSSLYMEDMEDKEMKKQRSIKTKVLVLLLLLQIPLAAVILIYNLYFVRFYNEQIAGTNRSALGSWCGVLEGDLKRMEERQLNYVMMNENFKLLASSRSMLDSHLYSYNVLQEYGELMRNNDWLYGCYIIDNDHQVFREIYGITRDTYQQKNALRQFFREYVKDGGSITERSWKVLEQNGRTYLYLVKGYRGTYSVYLADTDLLQQEELPGEPSRGIVLLHDNQLVGEPDPSWQDSIDFRGQDEPYFSGGEQEYLIIEQAVGGSVLRAAYVMKYQGFFGSLSTLQRAGSLFSIVLVFLLIFLGCYLLQRMFFRPVDILVDTMNSIKNGELETRAPEEFSEKEFFEVNNTFNNMIEQIQQLKIDFYEKELDLKQTQLNYYQSQIRPHFYVNCLKSIYGLLETGKDADARSSIIYLSRHLRYMLRGSTMVVSLEEELQYVENYMELQRIGMAYPPECVIELPAQARGFQIPAISILSFVENTVKYGMDKSRPLKIGIHISYLKDGEGDYLNIHISDNGIGFEEELLKKLNQYEVTERKGESVGIYNVMQRFWLYFGRENVLFAFSNMEGANVDIFIRLANQETAEDRK